jgi:RNA polymerase sigma-70 factor (ECF subfamily)
VKDEINAAMIAKSMKKGDVEVLLQWIDVNKQKLYRMSWSYLKNSSDVEDVFHNTIIKVFENINKLQSDQAFEGWFISILLNECRKILRDRRKVQPSEYIELDDTAYRSETQAESLDLIDGLKSIDEEYKKLIILKYCSGYSQKEIAEIFNMPIGTVKTKIFRGLKMLRKTLRREA